MSCFLRTDDDLRHYQKSLEVSEMVERGETPPPHATPIRDEKQQRNVAGRRSGQGEFCELLDFILQHKLLKRESS